MTMTKDTVLGYLGADQTPYMIYLFPKDFESKDELLEYLDAYNDDKEDDDKVIYMDQAELISSMSSSIMSAVTIVLIAFSSISLIVSSIMIGIITYISVLERTKEIGILRALGARKKDISRVFNAETFIIGITSGLIGIGIALIFDDSSEPNYLQFDGIRKRCYFKSTSCFNINTSQYDSYDDWWIYPS